MGPHDTFSFSWAGTDYSVPADEQTRLIAAVEDVVTAYELGQFFRQRKTVPTARLAMAWGIVLRHVGVQITDNEVRLGLFGSGATEDATITTMIALLGLFGALNSVAEDDSKANPTPDERPGAVSSSRNSIKPRSGKVG